jgi:hypothetical protein
MTSVFNVLAHEDNNDRSTFRKAAALARTRVEARFGTFVRQGSVEDQKARLSLVEDDVKAVIHAAAEEVGFYSPEVEKTVMASLVSEEVLASRTASTVHEARKPKMCPYHSEVVDISLAQGEPQAGFNAMAQHAWSDKHCQGEWEGGCNFKPQMTTQSYWDEKAERAEERKREREEQQTQDFETPRVEEIVEETPEVPVPEVEHPELDGVEDSATDVVEDTGGEATADVPMSMAASSPKEAGLEKLAPGHNHLPYASDKENRMYEHIKAQCMSDGGSEEHCKTVAAATVNKYRSEHGETKSHVRTADAGPNVVEGPGTPSPKMDKRKWTPTTVPHTPPGSDSKYHPTRTKDIVEPIKAENADTLKEIGERTTERQDVTQKGGPAKTHPAGSWSEGPKTAISSEEARNIIAQYRGN